MELNWWWWVLWSAVGILWLALFFGLEMFAVFNRPGTADTLSERVWQLNLPNVVFFMIGFALIGLAVWLIIHFLSDGKWGV